MHWVGLDCVALDHVLALALALELAGGSKLFTIFVVGKVKKQEAGSWDGGGVMNPFSSPGRGQYANVKAGVD